MLTLDEDFCTTSAKNDVRRMVNHGSSNQRWSAFMVRDDDLDVIEGSVANAHCRYELSGSIADAVHAGDGVVGFLKMLQELLRNNSFWKQKVVASGVQHAVFDSKS